MAKADCNHSITATRGSQLPTCPPDLPRRVSSCGVVRRRFRLSPLVQ